MHQNTKYEDILKIKLKIRIKKKITKHVVSVSQESSRYLFLHQSRSILVCEVRSTTRSSIVSFIAAIIYGKRYRYGMKHQF